MLHSQKLKEALSTSTETDNERKYREEIWEMRKELLENKNYIKNLENDLSIKTRNLDAFNILKSLSSLSTIISSDSLHLSPHEVERIRFLFNFAVSELISTAEKIGTD